MMKLYGLRIPRDERFTKDSVMFAKFRYERFLDNRVSRRGANYSESHPLTINFKYFSNNYKNLIERSFSVLDEEKRETIPLLSATGMYFKTCCY